MRIRGRFCIIALIVCSCLVLGEEAKAAEALKRPYFEPMCRTAAGLPQAPNPHVMPCFWEFATYLIPEDVVLYETACLGAPDTYNKEDCEKALALFRDPNRSIVKDITAFCCDLMVGFDPETTEAV